MDHQPLTRLEWIEQKLRKAIISGELRPGQKLITESLARQWNVSPTPLRETYQRLAAEGLVDVVPQRGARVSEISLQDAVEIYELRLQIEPFALERSLNGRDDQWEEDVQAAFAGLHDVLTSAPDDVMAFEQAHREFDEALLSRCGSSWLLRMIRLLRSHSARYRAISMGPKGGRDGILTAHEILYKACLEGSPDEAVEIFRGHLQLTLDAFTTTWQEEGPVAAAASQGGSD